MLPQQLLRRTYPSLAKKAGSGSSPRSGRSSLLGIGRAAGCRSTSSSNRIVGTKSSFVRQHQQQPQRQRRDVSTFAQKAISWQRKPTSVKPLVLGCVCYDPSVGDIWNGIKHYLNDECKIPFDFVLFQNYEMQVSTLANNGSNGDGNNLIDVAWNGPIAHVISEELVVHSNMSSEHGQSRKELVSLGMRDVDRDFESIVVVRNDANSAIETVPDLNGKRILTGSEDSPQAHVVPLYALRQQSDAAGTQLGEITPFNYDMGKHGDTAVGEIEALKSLLAADTRGDAALVSRMMWERATSGQLDGCGIDGAQIRESCRELEDARLPKFDHCQFDAVVNVDDGSADGSDDKRRMLKDFGEALLSMDGTNNPEHKRLMDLEGIKEKWVGPRQTGYDIVRNAMMGANTAKQHRPATNFPYHSNHQKRAFSSAAAVKDSIKSSGSKRKMKVAVIGAGVAGLQAIRALKARGRCFDVTAFEASSNVGGLWQSNYFNFGLQVPKQLFEFQDYPMTACERGEYPNGQQIQSYIENFANDFKLNENIEFETKVTSAILQRQENGVDTKWKIRTHNAAGGKEEEEREFDYLVVSTGLYSGLNKRLPSYPGQEAFKGDAIHCVDFTNTAVVSDKNVVVIGGGKSAVDCAVEAAKAGVNGTKAKSVTLLQREPHWPTPRKIAGIIPFQHIFLSRFGTALVSIHRGTFPGGSGKVVNAFRDSVVGPLLMRPLFATVEYLFAFQFGLSGELRPKDDVVSDFYNVAAVLNSELKEMRKAGKVSVKVGEVESFNSDGNSLRLKDGSTLPADLIVAATGYDQGYSVFEDDPDTLRDLDMQDDGMYLYRYILPEKVPNLAFIGHVGAISNISSYGLQAEWLARLLAGELVSFSVDENPSAIRDDIEARKEWARSWMPKTPNRGMLVLLHQTHYHDQLLRDMGINPHRKSNPLSEYLMPYESADYNGIMGGRPAFVNSTGKDAVTE